MHLRMKCKPVRTNNPHDWSEYKHMRNQVTNDIKKAKLTYYHKAFNDYTDDCPKNWRTINEVTSRESNRSVINQLDYRGYTP